MLIKFVFSSKTLLTMYESTPIWIDLRRRLKPTIFEMESCSTARQVVHCYLTYLRNLRHSLSVLNLSIVSTRRNHPASIRVDSFTNTAKELSNRKLCDIAVNDIINTCFSNIASKEDMMKVIPLFVRYCDYLYQQQQEKEKEEKESVFDVNTKESSVPDQATETEPAVTEKRRHFYDINNLDKPIATPDVFEVDIDEHVWGAHNPYGFRLRDRRSVTSYDVKTNFDEMFTKLDEIGSMKLAVCLSPNVIKINRIGYTRKDSAPSTAQDLDKQGCHNKMSMSRIGSGIRLNV